MKTSCAHGEFQHKCPAAELLTSGFIESCIFHWVGLVLHFQGTYVNSKYVFIQSW